MAGRDFAMVRKSLLRSRKFRGLSHEARWAWLCACLRSEWSGVFEYPKAQWSADVRLSGPELQDVIIELVECGVIEWSPETETVRIVGFIKQNPPDNARAAQRLCSDFLDAVFSSDGDQLPMLIGASCEFVMAAIVRAQRWKPDSPDWPMLRDSLRGFVLQLMNEFEDDVTSRLVVEASKVQKAALQEAKSLIPALAMALKSPSAIPYGYPIDTRRRDVDGDKDEYEYENKDEDDARFDVSANSSALNSVEPLEVLRRGKGFEGIATIHPLEETKRSALAVGGSS